MTIAVAASSSAPADESFGPFKYTAVSVRTKIDALGRAYRERWADDASLAHDAGLVESSYRVWAERYPQDPWLAPTALHLAQLYAEIQTPQARAKALEMFRFIARTFPATREGHLARLRLQRGLPPPHRESPVRPTPNPYARSASPPASSSPAASPSPLPSSSATVPPSGA
ncbi:MAG: hypothetical protein JWN27_3946 [Candidatus Eremiobacteraeota bacterium]|nr:hypothetical protein [Candidatus Eremiobacteraeota bacterium]